MEMGREVWRFLGESARRKATALANSEKLLVQDGFREPMLVRIPMPPWACSTPMRPGLRRVARRIPATNSMPWTPILLTQEPGR